MVGGFWQLRASQREETLETIVRHGVEEKGES